MVPKSEKETSLSHLYVKQAYATDNTYVTVTTGYGTERLKIYSHLNIKRR
jgi:hypothetical protein